MEDTIGSRNVLGIMNVSGFVLLFGTLVAGGILLVIIYIINELSRFYHSQDLSKGEEPSKSEHDHEVPQQGGKKVKNKKHREPQQRFTHSWLVGSLRGHTDSVLDLNFSTNGRYVGTCAQECWSWLTSPDNSSKTTRQYNPEIPIYYRRPPIEENVRNRFNDYSDSSIWEMLSRYTLSSQQLHTFGYPVETALNHVSVNYVPYPSNNPTGNNSNKTSDYCAIYKLDRFFDTSFKTVNCARCLHTFCLTMDNEYLYKEECIHHWGKFIEKMINGYPAKIWTCCQGGNATPGCNKADRHIWTGLIPGHNGPLQGYAQSTMSKIQPHDGFYGIYGLDCEMCFTRNGLEVIQFSLVDMNGNTVYKTYVKPEEEIIDYNTRFSGITANDLEGVDKTLNDVHKELASFINEKTILIGHGLENDLRALRFSHTNCIDSSILYPHRWGYPYRNSLKYLVRRELYRDIQMMSHDSAEDARAAVDLVLLKLYHDCSEYQL